MNDVPVPKPTRFKRIKSWFAEAKRRQAAQLLKEAEVAAMQGNSRTARYNRLIAKRMQPGKKHIVFRKTRRVFKAVVDVHSSDSMLKTYMAAAGIAGFGLGHDIGFGHFSISTLSIAASLGLINLRMSKILGRERARRQLLAKLVGKPQIGKRLARLIKDSKQREEIRILSQARFLSKEELQAIREELTTGKGRLSKTNQEAIAYSNILFNLFSKEPELVRTVLRFMTEKGESLQNARRFTIGFVKECLEAPPGYTIHTRYNGQKNFEITVQKNSDGGWRILKEL